MPLDQILWMLGSMVLVLGVAVWSGVDRVRTDRDLARRTRLALPEERCHRCGGEFEAWDGRLGPVRAMIDYIRTLKGQTPRFIRNEFVVMCRECRRQTVFWVWSDGKLLNRDRLEA